MRRIGIADPTALLRLKQGVGSAPCLIGWPVMGYANAEAQIVQPVDFFLVK